MLACGCLNPIDIAATLAGYGLAGIAVLGVAMLCLTGLLLGGLALGGNLVLRRWGAGAETGAETDGTPAGLASFTWEDAPKTPRRPRTAGRNAAGRPPRRGDPGGDSRPR